MTKKVLTPLALKIQKTPPYYARRKNNRTGKNFNMGLRNYIAKLFEINETLPRNRKMTDSEILRQIRMEFSHLEHWKMKLSDLSPSWVTKLRSEYNRGRLTCKGVPKIRSFAYDLDGDAINPRTTNLQKFSFEQKQDLQSEHERRYYQPHMKKIEEARKLRDGSTAE